MTVVNNEIKRAKAAIKQLQSLEGSGDTIKLWEDVIQMYNDINADVGQVEVQAELARIDEFITLHINEKVAGRSSRRSTRVNGGGSPRLEKKRVEHFNQVAGYFRLPFTRELWGLFRPGQHVITGMLQRRYEHSVYSDELLRMYNQLIEEHLFSSPDVAMRFAQNRDDAVRRMKKDLMESIYDARRVLATYEKTRSPSESTLMKLRVFREAMEDYMGHIGVSTLLDDAFAAAPPHHLHAAAYNAGSPRYNAARYDGEKIFVDDELVKAKATAS